MIHKKIEQLIPFVDENFITFPLWEEGIYAPSVNIWLITKEPYVLDQYTISLLENTSYEYYIDDENSSHNIYRISIFPLYDYKTYSFSKKWSIEEMIDLAKKIIDGHTGNSKQE